jgi:hypothetical protein
MRSGCAALSWVASFLLFGLALNGADRGQDTLRLRGGRGDWQRGGDGRNWDARDRNGEAPRKRSAPDTSYGSAAAGGSDWRTSGGSRSGDWQSQDYPGSSHQDKVGAGQAPGQHYQSARTGGWDDYPRADPGFNNRGWEGRRGGDPSNEAWASEWGGNRGPGRPMQGGGDGANSMRGANALSGLRAQ